MVFSQLIELWKKTDSYLGLLRGLQPHQAQLVTGLTDLPRAAWVGALFEDLKTSVLLITPTPEAAKKAYADLVSVCSEENVAFFPHLELLPYEVYARNVEIEVQRMSAMKRLCEEQALIVVTSAEAVMRKVIPREIFMKHMVPVETGKIIKINDLAVSLSEMGYVKENLVEIPGTFSQRGGLIDVYPPGEKAPVRIEFFDDEVESVRTFDPGSQRSKDEIDQVLLTPARDLPASREVLSAAAERLDEELSRVMGSLTGGAKKSFMDKYLPYLDHLREGIWTEGMEQLLGHLYPEASALSEYLPNQGLILLQEPGEISEVIRKMVIDNQSLYYDLLEEGKILSSYGENFLEPEQLTHLFESRKIGMFSCLEETGDLHPSGRWKASTREVPQYKGNITRLEEDLVRYKKEGYRIYISASTRIRTDKIREILMELKMEGVEIVTASLSRGFESRELKVVLLSETDILGQNLHAKTRRPVAKGEKIATFLDLKVGDYVVHVNHGIGRYLGMVRLEIGDSQRDYLLIQYAGEDKLYVPTDQVDLIQKYIGAEGHAPKLYKMGGTEWNKVKAKVRNSVQDMAKELLTLYAAREAVEGHVYPPDTVWQKEFEDAFPYPETPDQLRSIEEIKKDLESTRPMDRLLCGDVGYGKTEVALRIAFKVIMEGKQVAVLVPTTVLAQQHQLTFEERFDGFPVSVGALSRFKSSKSIADTLQGLEQGTVDLVIGTHRLLSKDVKFKDLGLLIIDEEQRFGVGHKEKIKNLKKNIDVLTLSATPIPRTLHMSLIGVRDMSVIETPPEDRQPVHTYVMEYQERVIREAILREINRGGQVYFVHNRVNNIYIIADQLSKLVPEAKIVIAHGQMKVHELENVMLDFIEGEANVLVSTTIVESGLDISNVNTLIVNDADNFGLSQLYQLRGRVGRSERQAFAYFTYRKDKILSEIAKKRLTAIRDFTELGSGFKIAMRDMEIRGAGNILGPEQHGHILAVGFDMYCRLVKEEVEAQRYGQEQVREKIVPLLELNTDSFIPDSYISETDLKIAIYKRLAAAQETKDVDLLEKEAEDRFGVMPEPVRNLFMIGTIKVLAQKAMVASIVYQKQVYNIRFAPGHQMTAKELGLIAGEFGRRISFSVTGDLEIRVKSEGLSPMRQLKVLIGILSNLLSSNGG